MAAFIIVAFQPIVQILLQLIEVAVELLPEGYLVELLQDRLVEALTVQRTHTYLFYTIKY